MIHLYLIDLKDPFPLLLEIIILKKSVKENKKVVDLVNQVNDLALALPNL